MKGKLEYRSDGVMENAILQYFNSPFVPIHAAPFGAWMLLTSAASSLERREALENLDPRRRFI
jgi:hypothetical protein